MNLARLLSLINQLQGYVKALLEALDGKARREGTVLVTWPGGSNASDIMTVAHGFDEAPKVWVQSQDEAGVGSNHAYVVDIGATTFRVQVVTPSFTPSGTAETPVVFEAWL